MKKQTKPQAVAHFSPIQLEPISLLVMSYVNDIIDLNNLLLTSKNFKKVYDLDKTNRKEERPAHIPTAAYREYILKLNDISVGLAEVTLKINSKFFWFSANRSALAIEPTQLSMGTNKKEFFLCIILGVCLAKLACIINPGLFDVQIPLTILFAALLNLKQIYNVFIQHSENEGKHFKAFCSPEITKFHHLLTEYQRVMSNFASEDIELEDLIQQIFPKNYRTYFSLDVYATRFKSTVDNKLSFFHSALKKSDRHRDTNILTTVQENWLNPKIM